MKRWVLALLLFSASIARAQLTSVSATVKDANGVPYAQGTLEIKLSSPEYFNGVLYALPPTIGLDQNGAFRVQLASSDALQPTGSTYSFTVCSSISGTTPPFSGTPTCFTVSNLTITGPVQNYTSILSSQAPTLAFGGTSPTAPCGDTSHALGWTGSVYNCQPITGTAAAGGSSGQLQWNNSTALGGVSGWTTNGTTTVTAGATSILDLHASGVGGLVLPGALSTGIVKVTTATGAISTLTAPTGTIVGTSDTQALTNKDLTGSGNVFPTFNQNTTGTAGNLFGCTPSAAGDICYWNGTGWTRLAGNASGTNWLQETSSGVPSWTTPAGGGTGTVTQVNTTSPVGGGPFTTTGTITCTTCVTSAGALTSNAVVIGGGLQASSTISADTTATHALFATAGAPAFRALATTDIPAISLTASGNGGVAANQGTTTTVLHGNAAGQPSFGAVAISSDVSGLGTGVATFLSTPNSANLASTVTDEIGSGKAVFATALQGTDANLLTSGTVAGTGATLCTDAQGGATTSGCSSSGMTNPMTTPGDIIYENATPAAARLAGPATDNSPYTLSSTPASGVAQAPTWTLAGVPVDTQSSATPAIGGDNAATPDRTHLVRTTNNTTSTATSLSQAGSAHFGSNIAFVLCNPGSVANTVTPTTSTVNGNTTLVLPGTVAAKNPACAMFWSDNTNYFAGTFMPSDANGRLSADAFPALTGDVTNSAGSLATTVGKVNGAVVPTSATALASNSSAQIIAATAQGNGAKVQLSTGTITPNDCVKFDANGNTVDAGAACGTSGGVTSFSGDTVVLSNSSSTGAVTATLANAAAGTVLGNATSSSAPPTYHALSAINPQTTTYQVLASDFSSYKTISVASGTFTITLVASGSQPAAGQYITVLNYGSGVVTIARSGQNINGAAANFTLNAGSASTPTSTQIWSDGTNYFAQVDEGTVGTVTSVATTSPITGGTITTTGTIACATCVTSTTPGAGVAHFAGSTQNVTSSAIVQGDVTNGFVDLSTTQASIGGVKTFTSLLTGTAGVATGSSPPTCTAGTGGMWCGTEGTAPTATASTDFSYADSTLHMIKASNNGGPFGAVHVEDAGATIVADSAAINTTDTIIVKTPALAANRLVAGSHIRIVLTGTCTSTVANTSTFTVRWGTNGTTADGTVAALVSNVAATSGTNNGFRAVIELTVRTAGASATSDAFLDLSSDSNIGISATPSEKFIAGTAFNTTTASGILSVSYKSAATTTTSTFKTAVIESVYE